jgi:calnexin
MEGALFWEPFLDDWESRWNVFTNSDFTGTWKHETYTPEGLVGDKGIVVSDEAKKHAVSSVFKKPIDPKDKGLVIQYEVQLQNGLTCGGAYIKLLTATPELSENGFNNESPYTIMFGPDHCGETNKVHFIMRHKNRISGEIEEKHLKGPPVPDTKDKRAHLYTAIISKDNQVTILVDNEEKKSVSLFSDDDWKPPIQPPMKIDDPTDSKPSDWVDEKRIPDESASKPDDWDEDLPATIDDPKASKPSGWLDDAPLKIPDDVGAPDDWDTEEDGEWEAPLIDNPACKAAGCGEWKPPKINNPDYKGKWNRPIIDNPSYIGEWKPRQTDNPNYYIDESPHAIMPIGGIGIELWTMQNGILFDNIYIGNSREAAAAAAAETFVKRAAGEAALAKNNERSKINIKPADGAGIAANVMYQLKRFGFFLDDHVWEAIVALLVGIVTVVYFCCFYGVRDDDEEEIRPPIAAPPPGREEPRIEETDAQADAPAPAAAKKGSRKKATPKTSD